MEDIFL
jgi:hypothetical protein